MPRQWHGRRNTIVSYSTGVKPTKPGVRSTLLRRHVPISKKVAWRLRLVMACDYRYKTGNITFFQVVIWPVLNPLKETPPLKNANFPAMS